MTHRAVLRLGAAVSVLLCAGLVCGLAPARHAGWHAEMATAVYEADDEDFPNPERGFFIQRSCNPLREGTGGRPLNIIDLSAARKRGISLLRMCYFLSDFRDAELPEALLSHVSLDFARVRQAGLKVIPRFAYNSAPWARRMPTPGASWATSGNSSRY